MDNVLKIFVLAAGIIVACVVISLTFQIARSGKTTANSVNQQIYEAGNDMEESGIAKYDGLCISGNDVLNAIRKYQDDVTIVVELKTGSTRTFSGGTTIVNTRGSADYINPIGDFDGKVQRDSNKTIQFLYFKEV